MKIFNIMNNISDNLNPQKYSPLQIKKSKIKNFFIQITFLFTILGLNLNLHK